MNDKESNPGADPFERERIYLEGLFGARINSTFFSFRSISSRYLGPKKNISQQQRVIALALGGFISLAMALSVSRTTALVELRVKRFSQ